MKQTFEDTLANNGADLFVRDETPAAGTLLTLIFEKMMARGWLVQRDMEINSSYRDHFIGKKGELKCKIEKYRMGIHFEFYQDVNTRNKNGGYFDFGKLLLMPYLIRCSFLVELNRIKEVCKDNGYADTSIPVRQKAYDQVIFKIKDSCHYKEGKELPDFEVPSYNAKDKDGNVIRNGEVKYFRDDKGRLQRGTVYHNINNMWWVILHEYEFTNMGSFEFFDLDSEKNRARKLVALSGLNNPKSRNTPDAEKIKQWSQQARKESKEERLDKANEILNYLYSISWVSRKFEFYLKGTGRLGLQEVESNSWGIHKVFDQPVILSLYGRCLPMSSTESSWVKGLREYVVHGKGSISHWFCNDSNGEGPYSHKWPEVREKLWMIGALATN